MSACSLQTVTNNLASPYGQTTHTQHSYEQIPFKRNNALNCCLTTLTHCISLISSCGKICSIINYYNYSLNFLYLLSYIFCSLPLCFLLFIYTKPVNTVSISNVIFQENILKYVIKQTKTDACYHFRAAINQLAKESS